MAGVKYQGAPPYPGLGPKRCKKHPRYKVLRPPTAMCATCRRMWAWRTQGLF